MKKLVTALIIILPLILIVALFTVTGIVRISADIPATGITINNKGDGVIFLDMADYSSPLYESDLGVQVLPAMASNRDYILSVTDADGNPTDIVSLDKDGAFKLNGIGIATLTYISCDGGYSDSVIFNISARGALDFTPVLKDNGGNTYPLSDGDGTDYQATITSGSYTLSANCFPSAIASAQCSISCQNDSIVRLNDANGAFNAVFSGNTVLEMRVDGANGSIIKTIALTVIPAGGAIIDGMDLTKNSARLSVTLGSSVISFGVQCADIKSEKDVAIKGADISDYSVKAEGADCAYTVTARLKAPYFEEASVRYTLNIAGQDYSFYVDYDSRRIGIYTAENTDGTGDITIRTGKDTTVFVVCTPHGEGFEYTLGFDGEGSFSALRQDGRYIITASEAGEATLVLSWRELDGEGNEIAAGEETRRVIAVNGYSSLIFAENAENYGLGKPAIASKKFDANGKLALTRYSAKFRAYDVGGNIAAIDGDIEFTASDPSVLSISREADGIYFEVLATGETTVTATWKYGELFGVSPATLSLQTVNGVEADSDEGLRRAFKAKIPVVLTRDVYLGENLFDIDAYGSRVPKYSDAEMRERLLKYTDELPTTFDWQYFKNIGQSQPSVRYCLDITSDLYGNGHTINAQYITDMLDGTDTPYDFALFKGPLDFVATNTQGIKLAAVKGQDNIVFLARTDGITIDNAVLKGCDDSTLYDDGTLNLSLLNSMGTTLEIMADVSLVRSRVMNGRTAVRIFGRDNVDLYSAVDADNEKMHAVIEDCVLQNAREFILKIGTNRVIRGTPENPSPALTDRSGNEYACNSPACDDYVRDDYFMSHYALTDVTLKDSVLRTSGLFTIGIESHFSGQMLADSTGAIIKLDGWVDLAATSYPAVLRLKGNVVLDDWKAISSIDSSTLIECNATQANLAFLALNISEMLKAVQAFGGDEYADLIADKDGEQYAHGGIAFYGGGRNYSALDLSEYTYLPLHDYNINLSILQNSADNDVATQGWMLPLAAGKEDFRFVIFDRTQFSDTDEK